MIVIRAGYHDSGFSDIAYSMCTLFLGATADHLPIHGDPTGNGQTVTYGGTAHGQYIPSENNLTEDERVENTGDAERTPFVWSFPVSRADWASRAKESLFGFLVAGRDVEYIDGRPFIRNWGPRRGRQFVDSTAGNVY